MRTKFALIVATCITTIFATHVFAQEAPNISFLKKLEQKTSKESQEKVYLHLDKPYYAIGDNIWFKVYTVDAKTSQPSIKSGNIYIELINEKDSINKQLKLPLRGGITWGNFILTDSLAEGNYRVRAYTQWMRNANTSFFYDKTIKIGNSWANKVFTKSNNVITTENNQQKITTTIQFADKQKIPYANSEVTYEVSSGKKIVDRGKGKTNTNGEVVISTNNKQLDLAQHGIITATITLPNKQKVAKDISLKVASKDVDVQFFAEGGKLIKNLPNKIGIKAVNNLGLGEKTKGIIVNNEGTEISSFETNKFGISSFFLNPADNQTYKANVEFADGTKKTIQLPLAETTGAVLFVNNLDSAKMAIKIYLSEDLVNKQQYTLVAHHNGSVYFSAPVTSAKQVTALVVPKDSIPSGVVQIALLDANFAPVNERVVFINNLHDKIAIEANELKPTYGKRNKVNLGFTATNAKKPVQGSFSVAVTNTAAVKPDLENESNILTRLLLTADIAGYVEKPNYYFLEDNRTTRTDLDNLLLTQGWRKINWKEIANNEPSKPKFAVEKQTNISGTVTKGGKPVVKGKITLVSFSGGFFMTDTLTDEKGRFNFDKIEFSDSTKFVVQARTEKDKKFVDIVMDIVPNQLVTKNPNTGDIEVNVNQSLAGYLEESGKYFDDQTRRGLLNKTILLDAVNIVEKRRSEINSSNLNGSGNADAVITAKDLEMVTSLSQYLQGRLAGVQISNGQAFARNNQSPMAIIVDGMNFGGEDVNLDDIVVNDIETVEILKSAANTAIYGMRGGTGVIVITTKKGGGLRTVNTYTPGLVNYNPKGYALVKEFYSPKYDVTPDSRPDLRTTVYWNPQIISDANGKMNFSFFNTDVSGTYRIVIEGIDATGNLARKITTYEVK